MHTARERKHKTERKKGKYMKYTYIRAKITVNAI